MVSMGAAATRATRSMSTRRPMSAAVTSASRLVGARASTRERTSACAVDGTASGSWALAASSMVRASSTTKKGLPPVASRSVSASSGSRGATDWSASTSPTSSTVKPPRGSSSARRSRWRWSRSVRTWPEGSASVSRTVARMSNRVAVSARSRCSARRRVERSAHWRSSMTSTSGATAVMWATKRGDGLEQEVAVDAVGAAPTLRSVPAVVGVGAAVPRCRGDGGVDVPRLRAEAGGPGG